MTEKNQVYKYLDTLKNNKIVAIFIVISLLIGGVGTFTDGITKTLSFVQKIIPSKDFILSGVIIPEHGTTTPKNIMVSVLWAVDRSGDDTSFQSANISNVDTATGKLSYTITFSEPPPNEVLMDIDGVLLGVGLIICFDDLNENGVLDKVEKIIGSSSDHAVTYLKGNIRSVAEPPEGSSRNKLWTLQKIKSGYSLNKSIPSEQHKMPVLFDDLVPTNTMKANIMIRKDGKFSFPNWT